MNFCTYNCNFKSSIRRDFLFHIYSQLKRKVIKVSIQQYLQNKSFIFKSHIFRNHPSDDSKVLSSTSGTFNNFVLKDNFLSERSTNNVLIDEFVSDKSLNDTNYETTSLNLLAKLYATLKVKHFVTETSL